MAGFVHLHVHSDFSLLDSAASVRALTEKAGKLGMSHIALTDHGNMFGTMDFIGTCKKTRVNDNPLKPIIGCEIYVSPGSRFDKKGSESDNRYYHLVLLAKNYKGYLNLLKLCSFAYTEGFYYRPRIDEELLGIYHDGLIALSACASGEIPRLLQAGKTDDAVKKALYYKELFGNDGEGKPNFYLEIQENGISADDFDGNLSQKDINLALIKIASDTGIPLVATNDVHYIDRDDNIAHDILLCIGTGKVRTDIKRKKFHGEEFYLKSAEEMSELFSYCPEAVENTVRIAQRCNVEIPEIKINDLPKYLPEYEIPSGFNSADDYLRRLTMEGLEKRYAHVKNGLPGDPAALGSGGESWEDIKKRAAYELDTIIGMGFTGYFLIVADFINWAKEHNIPVGPGRGSGAGSIAAYSLRITDIDPLKYNLLFERFLNADRVTMPDFDIDFANEGRESVINYVTEKYGRERVGQIITFGTLGAKAAVKDVARVLGISIPESEMITKLIPKDPKINLKKAIEGEKRLQELEEDPCYTELFKYARKLEGLHRHSSIHAAGLVITRTPLHDFVPLFRDTKTGSIATQYSMSFLEPLGLIKMDFLGLKTLDVIQHTEEIIRRHGGEYANFDIEKVPENDEETFKMLGEGKSFGIFQFESDGMQGIIKRAKPGSIEDLTALNSLYRPGPMDNIDQFIDSKNGKREIIYPDPSLEEVLKETYGVIVYQEQVMQVARIIAGFSLSQADILRWAMGKKIIEKMNEMEEKFITGAIAQGHSEKKAKEIFDLLIPFAGYGFNKSHAAAYSVVAYHTAYLKANFPAEFMAANLSNEINSADKDKLPECISEARKMGLTVDPPDINNSQKLFTVVDGRIFYGLLGIKGIGEGPAGEIVTCRTDPETGKYTGYTDFLDFLNKVDIKAVGKSVIEKLILTGAFDKFGITRETLKGNLDRAIEYSQNIKDDKKFGQASLFGGTDEKEYGDFVFDEYPAAGRSDILKNEKDLIGFYFSGHPLDEYKELWEKLVKIDLGKIEEMTPGSNVLVGLIKTVKVITTARGDKMAFASLEDYNGEIELVFFSRAWEKCYSKIETDKTVILKGKLEYQAEKDKYSFNAEECIPPDQAEMLIKEEEEKARKWDKYKNIWKYQNELGLNIPDLTNIEKIKAGKYTLIGTIKSIRTHIDKHGKEMAFVGFEDQRGSIDLLFFSKTWESSQAVVTVDEILAIKGNIETANGNGKDNKISIKVTSVMDLNKLLRQAAKKAGEKTSNEKPVKILNERNLNENILNDSKEEILDLSVDIPIEENDSPPLKELHIRLAKEITANEESLNSLKDILINNPGPSPVYIHIPLTGSQNSRETIIKTSIDAGINISSDAWTKCSSLGEVWYK